MKIYGNKEKYMDLIFCLGLVNYEVVVAGSVYYSVAVTLRNQEGQEVATGLGSVGQLKVPNANFWWPYLMTPHPGYLYSLEVSQNITAGSLGVVFIAPFAWI